MTTATTTDQRDVFRFRIRDLNHEIFAMANRETLDDPARFKGLVDLWYSLPVQQAMRVSMHGLYDNSLEVGIPHQAAFRDNVEALRILSEAGVNLDHSDNELDRPYSHARSDEAGAVIDAWQTVYWDNDQKHPAQAALREGIAAFYKTMPLEDDEKQRICAEALALIAASPFVKPPVAARPQTGTAPEAAPGC